MTIPQVAQRAPLEGIRNLIISGERVDVHYKKLIFPGGQGSPNMTNTVAQQTSECYSDAIGGIPQPDSYGLLTACIPHAGDEHESWI